MTIEQQVIATIKRIRREDSDFITPESICAYVACTTEQARAGIVAVLGQEWLDRQDASVRARAEERRTAQLWAQDAKP